MPRRAISERGFTESKAVRYLGKAVERYGSISGAAEKMHIPRSTMYRWVRDGRVPEKTNAMERVRHGLNRIHFEPPRGGGGVIKPPPGGGGGRQVAPDQGDLQVIAHLALATGRDAIASPGLDAATIDKIAAQVSQGKEVAGVEVSQFLASIYQAAIDAWKADPAGVITAGDAYTKEFERNTAGQIMLRDAWLRALEVICRMLEIPLLGVIPESELDESQVLGRRERSKTTTFIPSTIWELVNYMSQHGFPAQYFYLVYSPVDGAESVFQVELVQVDE